MFLTIRFKKLTELFEYGNKLGSLRYHLAPNVALEAPKVALEALVRCEVHLPIAA